MVYGGKNSITIAANTNDSDMALHPITHHINQFDAMAWSYVN